jgi:hypothetical protein
VQKQEKQGLFPIRLRSCSGQTSNKRMTKKWNDKKIKEVTAVRS